MNEPAASSKNQSKAILVKTQTMQHVPVEEVKKAMDGLVETLGAQNKAAKVVGVDPQDFNRQLHGGRQPSTKVLDHFGLETRKVYVKRQR